MAWLSWKKAGEGPVKVEASSNDMQTPKLKLKQKDQHLQGQSVNWSDQSELVRDLRAAGRREATAISSCGLKVDPQMFPEASDGSKTLSDT